MPAYVQRQGSPSESAQRVKRKGPRLEPSP